MAGIPNSSFSISISATPNIGDISTLEQREAETLTQERLEQLWAQLIEKYADDEKLHELIVDKKVELKNNNLFNIQVPNLYFDTLLQPYQMRILGFLREATHNDMLLYKVVVVYEKTTKKAYLPSEKFEEMASRNPSLLTLRKIFPDIDF